MLTCLSVTIAGHSRDGCFVSVAVPAEHLLLNNPALFLQSPHWSLASFGFQQRRPPLATGSGERKGAAKFAVLGEPAAWSPAPQHAAAQPWWSSSRCAPSKPWRLGLAAAALLFLLVWGSVHLSTGRSAGAGGSSSGNSSSDRSSSAHMQQQQQQQQCRLAVRGSVWDQHCQRLEWVCVDQGILILHGDRYQQLGGRKAGKLPELLVDTSKVTGEGQARRLTDVCLRGYGKAAEQTLQGVHHAALQVCFSVHGLLRQCFPRMPAWLPTLPLPQIYEYPWRASGSSSTGSGSSDGAEDEEGAHGGGGRRLRYQVQEPTRTRRIPPLPMRPAASQEPAPYLQVRCCSPCLLQCGCLPTRPSCAMLATWLKSASLLQHALTSGPLCRCMLLELQEPRFSTCTVPIFLYASWRNNFFHVFKGGQGGQLAAGRLSMLWCMRVVTGAALLQRMQSS